MAKIGMKQSLRLSQQLTMTPQLQQAIKLLQLSRIELEEFVTKQLEENPILEEGPATVSGEEKILTERERETTAGEVRDAEIAQTTGETADQSDRTEVNSEPGERSESQDNNWEEYSQPKDQTLPSTLAKKGEDFPNYENTLTKRESLSDYLLTQVSDLDLDDEEKQIAEIIIGNLDDGGYLELTLEEIVGDRFDLEKVEGVLDVIQRMDPPGVAARDLKECLLNQLRFMKLKNGVVEKLIENHLSQIESRNYAMLAKTLGVSVEKIIESVQVISELEPVPGRQFVVESPQYIVPDVNVFKMGGKWHVVMNEDGLPRLSISEMYKDMLEEPAPEAKKSSDIKESDKEYLFDKLRAATWLIKSLQQRQKTIYRVTQAIVDRQTDFFEHGVEHLKPMILKDIAEDIEMHESNISRVTTNKFVQTPRGVYELKYFFNSSISTESGESMASESVKNLIKDMVKAEDSKRPLSDKRIVELLEEKGIHMARRTVAKYREQLNIAPSSRRKNIYG